MSWGTRDYQHATPARQIQWKVSARLGRLQEKVCEPSVQEKILICVDALSFKAAGQPEAFECMLEAVAAMAAGFDEKGNAVGLLSNADLSGHAPRFVPLGRNSQNLSRILETLARIQMTADRPLADHIRHHARGLWGINCLVCAYAPEEGLLEIRHELRPKRMPVQFLVVTADVPEGVSTTISRHIRTLKEIGKDIGV